MAYENLFSQWLRDLTRGAETQMRTLRDGLRRSTAIIDVRVWGDQRASFVPSNCAA